MKFTFILVLSICVQCSVLFAESLVNPFEDFTKGENPFNHSQSVQQSRDQILIGTEESRNEALIEFMNIVTSSEDVSERDWTYAAMRIAEIHEKNRNAEKASRAWLRIAEKSTLKDDADYAKAKAAEILCDAGKGIYDNKYSFIERNEMFQTSIRLSEELMYDQTVNIRIQIFAQFIQLENYLFLGEFKKADELISDFLTEWEPAMDDFEQPDLVGETFVLENCPRRQVFTAKVWSQKAKYNLGNYQECIDLAEEILSDKWTEEDNYPNLNTKGYARIYSMMSLYQLGEKAHAKELALLSHKIEPRWFESVFPSVARKLKFPAEEVAPFLSLPKEQEF